MNSCILCGARVASGKHCEDCLLLSKLLEDRYKVSLQFMRDNQKWLASMEKKCKMNWYGSINISIRKGKPDTVRWGITEKLT